MGVGCMMNLAGMPCRSDIIYLLPSVHNPARCWRTLQLSALWPFFILRTRQIIPMLAGQQQQLISLIGTAVEQLVPDASPNILLERPKVAAHGDIATNIAMQLARPARRNPRELAQHIVDKLM